MGKRTALLLLIFFLLLTGCSQTNNESNNSLRISAAISLTDALAEIKEVYEKENDVSIIYTLAGSGTLARQIEQGAPVDLFISANVDWMDELEEQQLIQPDTREIVAKNNLVLIAHKDSSLSERSISELLRDSSLTIAIGNPDSVPVGKYTKEALISLNKWEELEDQFVFAKDVRQVLAYVETGNAELGFVYYSDTLQSNNTIVVSEIDKINYEEIVYPAAIVKDTKKEEAAKNFLTFLQSDKARAIFKKYGF